MGFYWFLLGSLCFRGFPRIAALLCYADGICVSMGFYGFLRIAAMLFDL